VSLEYNNTGQRWESFNADGSLHVPSCAGTKADHENLMASWRQAGGVLTEEKSEAVVVDQRGHSESFAEEIRSGRKVKNHEPQ
jgi:hypothetical protein